MNVAVVTRTKDRPILLERALESVLAQTFTNWHMVIINDGGDPAPVEALVAARRERLQGRVTIVHHAKPHGRDAAANEGLRRSSGELIAVHDDDDSWHPDFLAACVGVMKERASDPRTGGVATWTTRVIERLEGDRIVREREEPFLPNFEAVTLYRMAARNFVPPIALVYKRAVLDEIGGYREDLPVLEDWDFNLRLLRRFDIAVVPRALAYYHHRPAATASYSNTVFAELRDHLSYDARLQNELLRDELDARATGLGALMGLGRGLVELRDELGALSGQLHHVEVRATSESHTVGAHLHQHIAAVEARLDGLDARLGAIEARLAEIANVTVEHARRPPPRIPETLFGYVKDSVYNFAKRKHLIGGD